GLVRGRVHHPDGGGCADLEVRVATSREALRQPNPTPFQSSLGDEQPSWKAKTDSDGGFRIEALPARAALQLELVDVEATRVVQFALAPGEEKTLDLVLDDPVVLSGQVVDQNELPIADLELEIVSAELDESCVYFTERPDSGFYPETDSLGRFRQELRPGR